MTNFAEHLQEALGTGYELERELLGGGMSRVFVAKDRALGRTIVVKVLPPDLAAGVNRERFRREIQLAAQLQHPHIVPLLSAGEHGELLWYTMPYIDGESLRAALERKKSFSVREVSRVLHDVVDALAYAHKRGVVHRDIKPANILTQGSHALVTDFGVAKALSAALPGTGVTTAGMAIGTPSYMAPEQLAGDPTADHRIDLYAVGLLAYELLTGESPFAGPSPRETMAAQLTRDPKPLHLVNPTVPAALSSLIMRLLAKDPDQRPASADAVLDELDTIPVSGAVTPVSGGIMAAPTRSLTRVFAVIGLLAVVLVVTLIVLRPNEASRAQERARRDSARRVADSIALIAKVATASIVPPVLSHQDSLAIAEKVNKQVRAARLRDSVSRAKLRDSVQRVEERKARDSLFKAFGARSAAMPRRRVVILEPRPSTRWPDVEQIGRAVADSLRSMLAKRSYVVVNPDSVRMKRDELVSRVGRGSFTGASELAGALSSDLVVSIRIDERSFQRGSTAPDSAMLTISASDLTAKAPYNRRMIPGVPAWSARDEILGSLDALLLQTVGALDEMSRAPRKTAGAPDASQPPGFPFPTSFVPGRAVEIRTAPPKKPPTER
jgi:hypothetical protein